MRVALVTTALAERARGNHTTVQRWMRHAQGVEIALVPAGGAIDLPFVPDLVDGYHAYHGGRAARRLAERHGAPLVVNLGGTDLAACLAGDREVAGVLLAAACVTGAFPEFGAMLRGHFGRPVPYATVPRGVEIPAGLPPRRRGPTLRVLLPSGLRPAKDVLLALDLAARLRARGLPIELRVLGPALDPAYAAAVRARAAGLGFASVDEVEPERMGAAYLAADIVWNTSVHEGGSNALLEAAAHGCALFARDVPGNRELLSEEGAPGALFDPADEEAALAFHRGILAESDAGQRSRAAAGIAWLRRLHDPAEEARALVAAWRGALPARAT